MEIDITEFYNNVETRLYSNSIANSGLVNIGEITWDRAKQAKYLFIIKENFLEFLGYMNSCGMDNALTLNVKEANGLFIQYISSEIQERKMFKSWPEYHKEVSGSLFKSNKKIYICIDTSMYKSIKEGSNFHA